MGKQKAELRSKCEKEEARRVMRLRREEARIKGHHVGNEAWRRPSSYGREFDKIGPLPVKYLSPNEQEAATRPSRAYERMADAAKGPFRDVGTYPQLFPEPKILLNSARSMLSQG